jgi:FKBP-type peptidyl-prolyl cis-trans isomerase 2
MSVVNGNTVSVHYCGTLVEGEEFDNSRKRGEGITFKVGAGQMISGFEEGVVGMSVGDTKRITIYPENAYGLRNEEAVQSVSKTSFPDDFDYTVGNAVQGTNPDGQPLIAKIISEQAEAVTLDFNHPLAGQTLVFEIELLSIVEE